jgi:hypothetical protein
VLFHQLDRRPDIPDACSLDRRHRWVLRSQNGVTRVVYVSEFKGRSVSVVLHYVTVSVELHYVTVSVVLHYVTVSVNVKGADVFLHQISWKAIDC